MKKQSKRAKRSGPAKAKPRAKRTVRVPDPADAKGGRIHVQVPAGPEAGVPEEAAAFVTALDANQQIAREEPMPPGTTHRLETDAAGRKQLVRKRFSAI